MTLLALLRHRYPTVQLFGRHPIDNYSLMRLRLMELSEWTDHRFDDTGGLWLNPRLEPLLSTPLTPPEIHQRLAEKMSSLAAKNHELTIIYFGRGSPLGLWPSNDQIVRRQLWQLVVENFPLGMDSMQVEGAYLTKWSQRLNLSQQGLTHMDLFRDRLPDLFHFTQKSEVHGLVRARLDVAVTLGSGWEDVLGRLGLLPQFTLAQSRAQEGQLIAL